MRAPPKREMRVRYLVDRMTLADIPRVVEIERLAYSTPWPTSAYRKELQENRWAHYIVVRDTRLRVLPGIVVPSEPPRRVFPFSLLPGRSPSVSQRHDLASIVGFAGLWLTLDEAHVTTIAVHPDHRGRGLGELLLVSLIDIAYDIGARFMTLEVRVSNRVAQNLYRKYGFEGRGIRRRYYSDNHEDALIMRTSELASPSYRRRFMELKTALMARLEADDEPPPGAAGSATPMASDPSSGWR
jgi:ribosomal-protein-alanine N-acetyltransferase